MPQRDFVEIIFLTLVCCWSHMGWEWIIFLNIQLCVEFVICLFLYLYSHCRDPNCTQVNSRCAYQASTNFTVSCNVTVPSW